MSRIELPYQEVRAILAATAERLGCPSFEAMTIGQIAWHLTNRGLDGVGYVIRYLQLLQCDPNMSRMAISMLSVDMAEKLNSGERRVSAFTGVPAPLMLLPAASFRLDEAAESDGILFTFYDQTVVYSVSQGLRIESADPQGLFHMDPLDLPTCTASRVDFAEGAGHGIEFARSKLDHLALPEEHYTGAGHLSL